MMHAPLESTVDTSSHEKDPFLTKSLEKVAMGSTAEVFVKEQKGQSDAVANTSTKNQSQRSPRSAVSRKDKCRPRRRVRFIDQENGGSGLHEVLPEPIPPASEMSMEEKSTIWWQPQDFAVFKKTARVISCEIRRRQVASQTSYQSILWRTYDCCLKAKSEDMQAFDEMDRRHLFGWAEVGLCRRGLERWIIPQMAQDRQARKDMVIQGVLHLQKNVKEVNDPAQRAATICSGCMRLTRYEILLFFCGTDD
jgi:hypothetical protein